MMQFPNFHCQNQHIEVISFVISFCCTAIWILHLIWNKNFKEKSNTWRESGFLKQIYSFMELRTAHRCLPYHTPVPSLCNKLDTVVSVISFGLQDYCPTATFLCHLVHISFFTQGLALFGHFSFSNLLVKTVSLMFTLANIYLAAACSLLSSQPLLGG